MSTVTNIQIIEEFRAAIKAKDLPPPAEIIADGNIHRFSKRTSCKPFDDFGWYVLFSDGLPAGSFGCWESEIRQSWCAKAAAEMTPTERASHAKRVAELRRTLQREKQQRHAETAALAKQLWKHRTERIKPESSPYLLSRLIDAYGLRRYVVPIELFNTDPMMRWRGQLVVPLRDIKGKIHSLQFITDWGMGPPRLSGPMEVYLPGGRRRGCFHLLGTIQQIVCITVEYATGASVHYSTKYPTVIAFEAGNLLPVARVLRAKHPAATIVLCADNDIYADGTPNRGVLAATEAAKAIDGLVAMPELDGKKCDFNDLWRQEGSDAVREAIAAARSVNDPATPNNILPGGKMNADTPSATPAHLHTPPALAHDPHILAIFEQAVQACGVVGEVRCAKLVFLMVTSRILDEPVSGVIKGLSSSGKSFTVETALKFFPEDGLIVMTAMSERALIYMDQEFSHRTLVIFEASALREQREKTESNLTAYFVRTLLSEGRIAYPVTVRDQKGGFITKTIEKKGPTNVILTTTATELHKENETRLLSIPTDDSQAQTKAIMRRLAQGKPHTVDFTPWHDLQQWLAQAEHRVTIPYAAYLAENVPPVAVRLRRDFRSILRLIETHAVLHQRTRERDDDGRIVATEADYLAVRDLVADLVATGVGAKVPTTIRETVKVVVENNAGEGVTVMTVSKCLKLDRSAAQRRIQSAREQGYIVNLEDRKYKAARYVVGEPLPEELELLPLSLSACVQHSPPEGNNPSHNVSRRNSTETLKGVQVCNENKGVKVGEAEEVITDET